MKLSRLLFILSFLFLGACSSSKLSSPTVLIVGLSDPPMTLDPRYASDANSMRICDLIFQSLVGVSRDLKIVPEVATSWVKTPQSLTFFINPALHFQNGSPLTLDDIVHSILEYKKPSSSFASALENIEGVSSRKPNQIILTLRKDDESLLPTLTAIKILPSQEFTKSNFGRNPIGSGDFSFSSWTTGELRLQRFIPKDSSNIKQILFKFVRDENTRYLKILKGELDVLINELSEGNVHDLQKTNEVQVVVTEGLNFNYILLNLKYPLFQDLKVREALFAAIDREPIIKYKLQNLGTLAMSLLSPVNPFAAVDLEKNVEPMSQEEARKIISKLSLSGQSLSLKTSDQATENGQVIAEQLQTRLGLRINHQSFEWATYFSDVRAGRYQMAIMRWVGLFDPDVYRDVLASSEFAPIGHNRGFYSNKVFDDIVSHARYEANADKRKALYTKAQELIAHDLPILPLWYNANISILSKRIKNFKPSVAGKFSSLVNTTKD